MEWGLLCWVLWLAGAQVYPGADVVDGPWQGFHGDSPMFSVSNLFCWALGLSLQDSPEHPHQEGLGVGARCSAAEELRATGRLQGILGVICIPLVTSVPPAFPWVCAFGRSLLSVWFPD